MPGQAPHSNRQARTGSTSGSRLFPPVIVLVAGVVCYGLFYRRGVWLSVIAYSVAPAERVMHGEAPYRDFLFNYTPGVLWLNAGLMRLFGASLLTVNTGLLVFKASALLALFFAARRVVSEWAALLPVALTLSWLGHRHIFNVHPAQYYLLPALVALILLLDYNRRGGSIRLAICGIAIGLVFVFKYNVGLVLLATLTTAAVFSAVLTSSFQIGRALKAAFLVFFGFGGILLLVFLWLQRTGALGAMISHFLRHSADYADERAIMPPSPRLLLPVAAASLLGLAAGVWLLRIRSWKILNAYVVFLGLAGSIALLTPGVLDVVKQSATAAVAYLPILIMVGAGLILLTQLRASLKKNGEWQSWWKANGTLAIVALFSVGIYSEVFPRADYYHLIRILPPLFLLALTLIGMMISGRSVDRPVFWRMVSVPVLLLALTGIKDTWIPQFAGGLNFADDTPLTIERAKGMRVSARDAELVEEMVSAISNNTAGDDTIFSFARRGGAFYFLAGRRNPTRLLWWDSVGIEPGDREQVLHMIERREIKLILVQDAFDDRAVYDKINAGYHKIASVHDLAVFDRNQ